MFSKISFRHLCSHRKLAGLAQLVHDSSLRVVLYLRPRRASVREKHPPPPPPRKGDTHKEERKKQRLSYLVFLADGKTIGGSLFGVGIVVRCLSNASTDFFYLLFCFFIYETSPEISTIYLISLMRIVQMQFRQENNWNVFKNTHNLLL